MTLKMLRGTVKQYVSVLTHDVEIMEKCKKLVPVVGNNTLFFYVWKVSYQL